MVVNKELIDWVIYGINTQSTVSRTCLITANTFSWYEWQSIIMLICVLKPSYARSCLEKIQAILTRESESLTVEEYLDFVVRWKPDYKDQ